MARFTLSRRALLALVSAALVPFLPAPAKAEAMPNDLPDYQGTGAGIQSVSDPLTVLPVANHPREALVRQVGSLYTNGQWGRILRYEDCENATLQWSTIAGTVASDSTTYLTGSRSIKLTTAGGAGAVAQARVFTPLAADQSVSTFPLVVVEARFKPADANLRSFQLFLRLDDTVGKFQAAWRFQLLQAGSSVMQVQYLDSTGNFQNLAQYVIRQGDGTAGGAWHHALLGLNYKQASYCTYALAKIDDGTVKPVNPPNAQLVATSGVRESVLDLIAEGDNASVTSVFVDEIVFGDLSNLFQL